MKSCELFAQMSPETASLILQHLHDAEKPSYKAAIQTLAAQRKLRPVFVERKPRDERNAWLKKELSRPNSEMVSANVIQMWLMGSQSALLCDFLDALDIPHDDKGGIDDLPPAPGAAKLQTAVDAALAKHPPENVAIYLQSFQAMDIAGWPELGKILENDDRLAFKSGASANGLPPA